MNNLDKVMSLFKKMTDILIEESNNGASQVENITETLGVKLILLSESIMNDVYPSITLPEIIGYGNEQTLKPLLMLDGHDIEDIKYH